MEVLNFLRPALKIDWDIYITHLFSDCKIDFQKRILLSFGQARKIRRILATKNYIMIVLIQNGQSQLHPITLNRKPEIKQITESKPSAPVIAQDIKSETGSLWHFSSLYPSLKSID